MGRTEKFASKLDPEVIGEKYEATKELSVRKQTAYFKSAVELEEKVKKLVDDQPSIYHHFYIAFAEEFWKKKTYNERLIIFYKWRARGLDLDVLVALAWKLFNWKGPWTWIWDETSIWDTDIWW